MMPAPMPMILDALKKELERRKWTTYQLAQAVKEKGGSFDSVYRFFRGEREPTTGTIERMCDVLELELKPKAVRR